jgi:hypothetical protein
MSILNSDKYFKASKIIDMFKVEQLDCPDMTVHINQGTIIYKNQIINFSEQDSEVITAPRIGSWLVVLSINEKGELVYTYGVQSTEQKMIPTLPNNCFHLCIIEVSATSAMITNDMIYDLRQIYTYSGDNDTTCTCKCSLEEQGFSEADRKQLKEFYDKYEEVNLALDKIKLALEPKKEYHVLSDSGLEYIVRFKDSGEPYITRVGYDDNPKKDDTDTHKDYKFIYNNETINIVNESEEDFVQVAIKIKSYDSLNDNAKCTLFLRCNDTTIYGANYVPQYRENEFMIENLELTKSGYSEVFSLKFHNTGNHTMSLLLYDNETKKLIDKGNISYDVTFGNKNLE